MESFQRGPPRAGGPAVQAARRCAPSPSSRPSCPPGGSTTFAVLTDVDRHVPARHLHHPQLRERGTAPTTTPAPCLSTVLAGASDGPASRRSAASSPRATPRSSRRPSTATGRFRNFLSFDRRWLEEVGSEDSHGRALWALGHLRRPVARARCRPCGRALRARLAAALLEIDLAPAWAFALLGIHEYLRRFRRDAPARQARDSSPALLRRPVRADGHARLAVVRGESSATTTPGCRRP